ncbi:hypothetical protein TCAL_14942 [Tigriopus californicus]|uniref:SSD domain-containing protein n=1 Tax=Tigriopus californicus TaxID=6832 RepID=A0A553N846_TIGCA|nr:hypothetical protein TCAL_14942 [Tigriopus californicus]
MKFRVSEWMEAYFKRRHGQWVSAHPYLVIALTFLATVLGGVGLMNFHWEANAIKLWIPSNSDFTKDFNYLWTNHPPEMRFHSVLFTTNTGENMLQPKYFRQARTTDDSGVFGMIFLMTMLFQMYEVDPATLDFETQLIHILNNQDRFTDGFVSYSHVARSFSDIASANIFTDVNMVVLGFAIVFIYVLIMLGNFDCVENRVFVSLAGLVAVFMALIASYGICCSLGFPFSPLHNFIPFLILGLGIDDMFVIMQAWNKFAEHRKDLSKVEKFGETLQKAGVSITVTSLTDFLAFAIGASTLLPALKSFCMYCGIGILITYVLQATWFVAWMSIDQDRIDSGRTLLCTSQNSVSAKHVSRCLKKVDKNLLQGGFDSYGKVLSRNLLVKVGILSLTAVILAFSIWNTWLLEQKFDPVWFLPKDSYLFQWFELKSQYYPSQGETVHVFMTDLDLPEEFPKIKSVAEAISSQQDIISHVDSWALQFTNYVSQFEDANLITSDTGLFQRRLTQFLFSPSGSKYRLLFHYSEPVQCGKPSPNISMSIFEFTHRLLEGPSEQIPAMNRIKAIIREANFSGHVFPFSKGYATWETDEVRSNQKGQLHAHYGQ